MEHSCRSDDDEDRPQSQHKSADADAGDRRGGRASFRANRIDHRAAGHLPEQADHAADRENKADIGQRPFLGGQIDRDEWAKAGLNVRHEESEPIEPAQAGARRLCRAVFCIRAWMLGRHGYRRVVRGA
jgi:hypothetical protein